MTSIAAILLKKPIIPQHGTEIAESGVCEKKVRRSSGALCLPSPVPLPISMLSYDAYTNNNKNGLFFRNRLALDQRYSDNIEIWGKGGPSEGTECRTDFFFANTGSNAS